MKEITLPVQVFKEALPGLNKIVARKTTLPVLGCLRIARDSDGQVRIQATDLDAFATYTVKDPINGPVIDLLVPLEALAKTVKMVGADGNITLAIESKDRVKLRYSLGGSVVERSISTNAIEEYPPQPQITEPPVHLESGFGVALRQALECCSDDSSRLILNSACLDTTDKKLHYVVGTNGCCLFAANSFCFDLKKPVVIPDSKFLAWTDFLGNEPASLTVQPSNEKNTQIARNWLKVDSGRWSYITREVEGIYPNWRQCVPKAADNWTKIEFSESALKQLVLVLPNLPNNDSANRPVRFRVNKTLFVEGKGDDAWTTISVDDVKITGKDVQITLNRQYVLNALKFGLNKLEIEDPLSPVLFSNGGKRLVVMPLKPDEPVPTSPTTQSVTRTPTERTEMPRGVKTTTATEPAQNQEQESTAVKSLVEHIDQIKETLKGVLRELNDVADALKLAEKEKKATDKEIENVRNKLLQIQKVTI